MTASPPPGDELRQQVIEALLGVAPEVDAASLLPDVSFRDQFDMDSVDYLNFVLSLEERLGVRIPELDYPKLSSLKGCLAYLATLPPRGGAD
jgi:acyl carrier protein